MLTGLTYSTRSIRTSSGYDFGHQQALISSPDSAYESIWTVDTSHAIGGSRKHGELIHTIAKRFIERSATCEHADAFRDCFQDGLPAIFLFHDGGEDPSDEPTKVVCIDPRYWRLLGNGCNPWHITYTGTVYDVEGQMAPYRDTGFWIDAWMHQITFAALEEQFPEIADQIARDFPVSAFSEPTTMAGHASI